jgi:hypothetical protein
MAGLGPATHDCVPGMALILEVQVLYGPIGRNRYPKATALPRGEWGGSRRQSLELTNRHRIPGRCDGVTRQWTGTPESQADMRTGKSGSDRVKDQCLTLGDLRISPDDRSRGPATVLDGCGEVSRGHSSSGDRAKG